MLRLPSLRRRETANVKCMAALGLALCIAGPVPRVAAAETAGPITVELNKLEPDGKTCRVYIVVTNPTDASLPVMKLDLIFFRPDAVIERRLAIDLGPVHPAKKSVKTFALEALPCEGIGSILLNDADCKDATGPVADCPARLSLSSRASAPLTK